MPKIVVDRKFAWADPGHKVHHFTPGPDPVDVPDRCAEVAIENAWARPFQAPKPAKAEKPAAPAKKPAAGAGKPPSSPQADPASTRNS